MNSTQQPSTKKFLVFPACISFSDKNEAIGFAINESRLHDGAAYHVENMETSEWVWRTK